MRVLVLLVQWLGNRLFRRKDGLIFGEGCCYSRRLLERRLVRFLIDVFLQGRLRGRRRLRKPLVLRNRLSRQKDRLISGGRTRWPRRRRRLYRARHSRLGCALCALIAVGTLAAPFGSALPAATATATPSAPCAPIPSGFTAVRRLCAFRASCRGLRRVSFSLNEFFGVIRRARAVNNSSGLQGFHGACSLLPRRLWTQVLNRTTRRNYVSQIVVMLFQFHKIGDVEEGVALQPDVDECRLHAGQHAGDAPFANGSR